MATVLLVYATLGEMYEFATVTLTVALHLYIPDCTLPNELTVAVVV